MSGEQKEVKLREVFQDEHFSEADLARSLNLSPSNAHYFRHKLLKQKKIARVGRGKYRFVGSHECSASEFRCEPLVEYIRSSLQSFLQPTVEFSITSCSLFNRFYPLYNYVVIYVKKGTTDSFLRYLPTLNLDFVVLLDPEKKDIELLRDAAHKRNFIIVREKSCLPACLAAMTNSLAGTNSAARTSSASRTSSSSNLNPSANHAPSSTGIADIEHAFVDYYFEVTRNKLPLENKSDEILDYILSRYTINQSKLLRYAKERGIRKEIEALFENISIIKRTNVSKKNDEPSKNDHTNNDDDKHADPNLSQSSQHLQSPQLNTISTSRGDHHES